MDGGSYVRPNDLGTGSEADMVVGPSLARSRHWANARSLGAGARGSGIRRGGVPRTKRW